MAENDVTETSTSPAAPRAPRKSAEGASNAAAVAAGVTPEQGVVEHEGDRVRIEAQNRAQDELRAAAEAKLAAERKAADERQAEHDAAIRQAQEENPPPTQVGDGGVTVQYLGTSDEFDFGPASDEDDRHVVAAAGGEPVSIPQDLYDRVRGLPYDQFAEVKS